MTQFPDGSLIMTSPDSSTVEVDTSTSPILKDINPLIAEVYPLPTKLKVTLSEDNVQHLDWKYLIRKTGKGQSQDITHIGKILKVCNRSIKYKVILKPSYCS